LLLQLTLERDEHKLVIDQLAILEPERKAFRLIGGILVEKTVGEALPAVQQNYEGVRAPICRYYTLGYACVILMPFFLQLKELLVKLDESLKTKDAERKAYKEKHGIMTQEEREAIMKKQGAVKQAS
jgi:prefoldin subunit 2